jgi:hypothetical protein
MAMYVKRVQTVLSEEEYQDLARLAEERQKPISVLVREAIEEVYFQEIVRGRRRAALESLLALDAPVGDWPEMEQEIIRGQIEA